MTAWQAFEWKVYIKASERTREEGEKGNAGLQGHSLIRSKASKKKKTRLVGIHYASITEILDRDGKNYYHANFTAGVFAERRTTLKFSV